jgi:NAD+ kinase
MKWGIVVKPNDTKARKLAEEIISFLGEEQEIYLEKSFADAVGEKGYSTKDLNRVADIIITTGGDGTILYALQEIEKPIFAVNCSAMGFLTEVSPKYAKSGIKRILEGDYNIEERARLKILLNGKRVEDASNELTIQTASVAKIIEFSILVNEELVDRMMADGIIVATPCCAIIKSVLNYCICFYIFSC